MVGNLIARAAPLVVALLVAMLVTLPTPMARAETDREAAAAHDDAPQGRWGFSVLPRFLLSNDEGFGAGLRGTAFWHRGDVRPYKTAVTFQAFATTRLVQHHFLRVDALDAFQLPLRITAEAGYFQTINFNYCGLGGDADCDAHAAEEAAHARGLVGDEADVFARRYYQTRFLRPYANAVLRFRLGDKPHRPELVVGWRGHLYQPGDFVDEDEDGAFDFVPYPGSLYAKAFPKGEPGFASVLQVGASLDDRDDEPDPSRGYLVELSFRGAAPFLGSAWTFGGANLTARLYVPLLGERRLTLASRYVVDALVGDAPLMELARPGGFVDFFAYGGADAGRGIRQQRFPGGLKLLVQQELRGTVASFTFLAQDFRLGLTGFIDAGVVAADALAPTAAELDLHLGAGVGLRLVVNRVLVMRVDLAMSPTEGFKPFLYTKPDHPY